MGTLYQDLLAMILSVVVDATKEDFQFPRQEEKRRLSQLLGFTKFQQACQMFQLTFYLQMVREKLTFKLS
jgi:hypothetical protein